MSFRKFAGAFADGELDVRQNLEALEHINMCPACAGRVEETTRLRSAVQRQFSNESAPSRMHREVRGVLQREGGMGVLDDDALDFAPDEEFALPVTGRRYRRRGSLILAGLIAAFLVVAALWPGAGSPRTAAAQFVDAVRDHHLDCRLWRGGDFLDMGVVRKLETETRAALGFKLAIPDLKYFRYRLRSACQCALNGVPGVHLTYVIPESGERVSVFTTPPQPELAAATNANLTKRRYYVSPHNESPAVVAWHEEKRSIITCAGIAPLALVDMIDQVPMIADREAASPSALLASSGF